MDYKTYALMSILMASVASVALVGVAYAQTTLTVETDADSYATGDDITISGQLDATSINQPILLQVLDPQGNRDRIDQVEVAADGSYSYTFRAGGLMNTNGEYTVVASYKTAEQQTKFHFAAGQSYGQDMDKHETQSSIEIAADVTRGSSSKTTDAYAPNPINANVGDTITWTNRDSAPHTVTSGINGQPDGKFDSSPAFNPLLGPQQVFSHKFDEPGEYPYYCALHPNMVGTIVVHGTRKKEGKKYKSGKQEVRKIEVTRVRGQVSGSLRPAYDRRKVFIVHGHNNTVKYELASFLRQIGLDPIILHEKVNEGKTIIEKLEKHTNRAGYAFILLTPDDKGGKNKRSLKPRARQNVILELGIFMGKLGRKRVCCLYREGVELPSDIQGMLYLPFRRNLEECHLKIIQELRKAGYDV